MDRTTTYRGCPISLPTGDITGEISEYDIADEHFRSSRERAIIPTVLVDVRANGCACDVEVFEENGGYGTPREAVLVRMGDRRLERVGRGKER
jgi:hypothetical protein